MLIAMADQVPRTLFIDACYTAAEIPQLLEIRTRAMSLIQEGKTIMSWGSAGNSASKQMVGSPSEILQAVGYALRKLDPATYGYNVTKTKPSFNANNEAFTG